MKIVKELENSLNFEEVEKIYSRGGKIAVSYGKETIISFIDTIDYGCELDSSKVEFVNGFTLRKGHDIVIDANTNVTVESIYDGDICGCMGVVKPFVGVYKDCEVSFCLYEDGIIGDKVYEVAL